MVYLTSIRLHLINPTHKYYTNNMSYKAINAQQQTKIANATVELFNADNKNQKMIYNIAKHECKLRQTTSFKNAATIAIENLKTEKDKEYNILVQATEDAVKVYATASVKHLVRKIQKEENQLTVINQKHHSLTNHITVLKEAQIATERNVQLANVKLNEARHE